MALVQPVLADLLVQSLSKFNGNFYKGTECINTSFSVLLSFYFSFDVNRVKP